MRWVEKLWSRKFWVLVLATVGLYMGKLDSWAWVVVAGMYIGGNVFQKLALVRRNGYYRGPGGE